MRIEIEKDEIKILIIVGIFIAIWTYIVLPFVLYTEWFFGLYPLLQYFLNSLIWIFAFVILIGIPLSLLIYGELKVSSMVLSGLSIWVFSAYFYDILQSPFAWDIKGNLIMIPTKDNLVAASVDYSMGRLYFDMGWVTADNIYNWVYRYTPMVAVFVSILFLTSKKLFKRLTGG